MDAEMRRLYELVQAHLQKLRDYQASKTKAIENRHTFGAQKSENELVKHELGSLEAGASVYKLIGPALVSQNVEDARSIIEKRLEYINAELKKADNQIDDIEKREEEARQQIGIIQKQMQDRQAQAAGSR